MLFLPEFGLAVYPAISGPRNCVFLIQFPNLVYICLTERKGGLEQGLITSGQCIPSGPIRHWLSFEEG
jgi:hypothetical protein